MPGLSLAADIPRPIDRLSPPRATQRDAGAAAERSRLQQDRQDSRSQVRERRLEADHQGELSPTRRAQDALPESPGLTGERVQEEERRLQELGGALEND